MSATRGQIETSFHWLFVIIAGGAILVLFLFLIKGCVSSGTEGAEGVGLASAARQISSGAWQGVTETNLSLPDATVVCPEGGSVTLLGERQQASADGAPAFLPPSVGGPASLRARPYLLRDADLPIALGGVLLVHDEATAYLILEDDQGRHRRLLDGLSGIRTVTVRPDRIDDLASLLPDGSRRVVIVTWGGPQLGALDLAGFPSSMDVRGVALEETDESVGGVRFFRRDAGSWREVGRARYAGVPLGVGAALSADPELFACGVRAVSDRARVIATVASERISGITDSGVDQSCLPLLTQADGMLGTALEEPAPDAFLVALFTDARRLSQVQASLRAASCPVIA